MSNDSRFISLIELAREDRNLEYKQSDTWNALKHKIAKTSLGMANLRDGGNIIIGISKRGNRFIQKGMLGQHIKTFDVDNIQAYINRFADPYVHIELHHIPWKSKKFIVIVVHEFDEIPVVCKRDEGSIFREGAIYTRSNRIPAETCEVRSQTEMREIIEIAIEKGIRNLLKKISRIGILPESITPEEILQRKLDSTLFDKQLEGL